MNSQREVIYKKRRHALMGERIGVDIANMIYDISDDVIENAQSTRNYESLSADLMSIFAINTPFAEADLMAKKALQLSDEVAQHAFDAFRRKSERIAQVAYPVIKQVYENQGHQYDNILIPITDGKRMYNIPVNLKKAYETEGKEIVKAFEKKMLLFAIDEEWKEHLRELDELRHSVQNATYEQKDPLLIYKLESYDLFRAMVEQVNRKSISILMRGQIPVKETNQVHAAEQSRSDYSRYRTQKDEFQRNNPSKQDTREKQRTEPIRAEKTVGRNDPCPCGSGKKYKNCHGK
jgi:preprotein translocase subunit SecA